MAAKIKSPTWNLGDSGWEVEWCSKCGLVDEEHPEYGGDPDLDVTHDRLFRTKDEAMAFAREVYPKDQYGAVRVTEFRVSPLSDEWPYGAYREYIGDTEHYEGEDD